MATPAAHAAPAGRRRTPDAETVLCAAVFLACLAHSLTSAGIGWGNTILGPHGFRQTQTAISTYEILEGGPWLAYETPVLGAPWSIPFEFPLYQWIVALLVTTVRLPLDQAGRLVSEVFFYAALVPASALLASLRVRPAHRLLMLSLLLVSPQYLYWSRAFMIESTAFFLALSYLALALRSLEPWRPRLLLIAAAAGASSALVKATTFSPFLLAAILFLGVRWWRAGSLRFSGGVLARVVLWGSALAALPLVCVNLWTAFSDSLKGQNPLAAGFIDSAALMAWNFGSVAQRLSSQTWLTLWSRTLADAVGDGWVLAAAALLVLASRRRVAAFAVSVALFLSAPLIFTNLHVVHSYYAYANGVFAIAAVGWGVVACLERGRPWTWLGAALLLCALAAPLWRYRSLYLPVQRNDERRLLDTAMLVQSATTPDEVLLVIGLDWNSELPYYARRRALMNRDGRPPGDPLMHRALANLGERRLGAMVVCSNALAERGLIESWLGATGLSPEVHRTYGCEVYLSGGRPSVRPWDDGPTRGERK